LFPLLVGKWFGIILPFKVHPSALQS
jgi:hypothetical protein